MYHGNSWIQWADINSTKVIEDNINILFQQYSMKAIEDKLDPENPQLKIFTIDFNDENVKIKDHYGWTQLLLLRKFEINEPILWHTIKCANRVGLFANKTKIPVFRGFNDYVIGFHGDIRYKYDLVDFIDIMRSNSKLSNGYIRLINGIKEFKEIEFCEEFEELNTCESFSYFDISTKSKTFNCSGIYAYAG